MRITRRPYISWSQLNTWEKDPNDYYELYVLGYTLPQTPYLELGKWVATEIEKKKSKSELIEMIRTLIPICKEKEKKVYASYRSDAGKVIQLMGIFDGYNKNEIIEIKTGKSWNQRKVDNHGQLDFYALIYYLLYKQIPKVKLVWIETKEDNERGLYITGNIKTFDRQIRLRDISQMIKRVVKVDKEIDDMYKTLKQ